MAKTFHLTIARLGENLYDGEAFSVKLPGIEGEFEVLADHEAFISPLKRGKARVKKIDSAIQEFEIVSEGIAEVSRNQATILL